MTTTMATRRSSLGVRIGDWLWSFESVRRWKDPALVWAFQERFGVKKTRVELEGDGGNDGGRSTGRRSIRDGSPPPSESFVCVDEDAPASKKSSSPSSSASSPASSSSELSIKKRLRSSTGTPASSAIPHHAACSSSGYSSANGDADEAARPKNTVHYRITSKFWYWVFFLGTQLGDETYYSIFFSFWFWNIDGAVGRRLMLIWNLVMYIGQGMKDVIRWPRPPVPSVVQLEAKWAAEYGMPSTHAMVGLAVPCGILYFTVGRYQYPFLAWAAVAVTWCTLVCTSRLYLGMHSVADIYVGLIFSTSLLAFVLPLVDFADALLMSRPWAPVVAVVLSCLAAVYYPGSDRWTPARGDTTVILGSYLGVQLAVWCNFNLGLMTAPPLPPPYPILWPTYAQLGQTLLRMVVGAVILIATRAIAKPAVWYTACLFLKENPRRLKQQPKDINNSNKVVAELSTKFFTYLAIGFNTMFVVPICFQVMGIERSTFYTEI